MAGFGNLRIRAHRALAEGKRYALPRLEEILALAEFAALREFLDSRQVDRAALQAELDHLVEQTHEEAEEGAPSSDLPPELEALLAPIVAAAQGGEDVEPLLAELGVKLVQGGIDEGQVDEFLEKIRSGLKSSK